MYRPIQLIDGPLRRYRDFCDFKMAAAAMLDFQKFGILTIDPLYYTKSHQNRLQRYGDLMFFFKMAAVRHLGFVGRLL